MTILVALVSSPNLDKEREREGCGENFMERVEAALRGRLGAVEKDPRLFINDFILICYVL